MISNTEYKVDTQLLDEAKELCKDWTGKNVLNMNIGNFFYDAWVINPHYKNTVFEKILDTLPDVGEARIIRQECGTCYQAHSDIDDRYHLNIAGDHSCLIDLDTNKSYNLEPDGKFYLMDAGKTHSAANFGQEVRFQMVVRKLLKRAEWVDHTVEVHAGGKNPRFVFDRHISPILNEMNKRKVMNNFEVLKTGVRFTTNQHWAKSIKDVLPVGFKIVEH